MCCAEYARIFQQLPALIATAAGLFGGASCRQQQGAKLPLPPPTHEVCSAQGSADHPHQSIAVSIPELQPWIKGL